MTSYKLMAAALTLEQITMPYLIGNPFIGLLRTGQRPVFYGPTLYPHEPILFGSVEALAL